MIRIGRRSRRWVLFVLFSITALTAVVFGLRSYGSFLIMRSAIEAGAPEVSSIRPWMTLRYVAATYHVPEAALVAQLSLAPETDRDRSLRSIAESHGQSVFQYIERVQRAVVRPPVIPVESEPEGATWLGATGDALLSPLLTHGYPILGLTLWLGAIGLPVPTGLSAALAGSVAAQGAVTWTLAGAVAVVASVLGDLVGYGLGRVLSRQFLERQGHWLGYTAARRTRVEPLMIQWGGAAVLLSRTLASHLSAVLNLLAGASHYGLPAFVVFTVIGRLLWTSAYLGVGYGVGANLDAAASFLTNLSLLLVALAVLTALSVVALLSRERPPLSA